MNKNDPIALRLSQVCKQFRLPGELVEYTLLTSGNINTTYKVVCEGEKNGKFCRIPYIAQKVNQFVFKDPVRMMQNIDLVTEHIMAKKNRHGTDDRRTRLHFHHTAERNNYWFTGENNTGDFWRVTNYVDDAIGPDTTEDIHLLTMVGRAFGEFQNQLRDFDASLLVETIPNFHNTPLRLETLFAHAEEDPCGRRAEVEEELAFIASHRENCGGLVRRLTEGVLPLRVTHNDTKGSNCLLDKDTLEPLVVIDLDTVMPGLAAYDFGDAVRSAACTAEENERDLSKVRLDLERYRGFAQGFIAATADSLTEEEIDSMADGAVTITIELASRFLDDYLTGDHYFKISDPDENLVRTRCQIALAKDMLAHYDEMKQIVREVAAEQRNKH